MNALFSQVLERLHSSEAQKILHSNMLAVSENVNHLDFGENSQSTAEVSIPSGIGILRSTSISIEKIYEVRKKRSNLVFYTALVIAVLTVLLIFALVIWTSFQEDGAMSENTGFKVLFPTITTVLNATLFVIYRKEEEAVKRYEKDLMILNKVDLTLVILSNLEDEALKLSLISKIVSELKI